MNSLNKILGFLNVKIEESEKNKMIERSQFHSKRPNTVFDEKPLESQVPNYQKYVFELYEQLKEMNGKD